MDLDFKTVSTDSHNVDVANDDKYIYFRLDRTVTGSPSKTGKTTVIASTHGNQKVNGGLIVGLNVYRK